MKPTKEQLNDPKFWDVCAPDDATHYNRKINTWVRRVLRTENEWFGWFDNSWDCFGECSDEYIANHFTARPEEPQWRGPEDGLPPARTKCDIVHSSHDDCNVTITYMGDGVGCYKKDNGREYTFATDVVKYRPIKSDRERESVVEKAMEQVMFDCTDAKYPMMASFARRLYDAGFLRKPMSREEAFSKIQELDFSISGSAASKILNALGYKD